ncbi:protein of unknown function [Hyphomicrobium sp. MC1]|nr:protein of unknown function [Hyphomicrobium sp. MC1]
MIKLQFASQHTAAKLSGVKVLLCC